MSAVRPLSDVLGRFRAFKHLRAEMTTVEAQRLLEREFSERRIGGFVHVRGGNERAFRLVVFGNAYAIDEEFDELGELVDSMRRRLPKRRWRR